MAADTLLNANSTMNIIVKPRRRLVMALVVACLLAWWIEGGYSLIRQLAIKDVAVPPVFLYIFIALWAVASCMISFTLVRLIFCLEVLSFDGKNLVVEQKIGSMTVRRSKTFSVAHIRDMELEQRISKFRGRPTVEYAIIFEYLGDKEELVGNLGKQQAQTLLVVPPLVELVKQSHCE